MTRHVMTHEEHNAWLQRKLEVAEEGKKQADSLWRSLEDARSRTAKALEETRWKLSKVEAELTAARAALAAVPRPMAPPPANWTAAAAMVGAVGLLGVSSMAGRIDIGTWLALIVICFAALSGAFRR